MNESIDNYIADAVAFYGKNPTWKARYDKASPNVKRYFQCLFSDGYATFDKGAEGRYAPLKNEIDKICINLYMSLTDDEWEEAMRVSGNRMGLTMARQKYRQRKD